jgi:hypothetical protein
MHAIDDGDRWNRILGIAVPVVSAVTGIATYWLVWDGGVQVVVPAAHHRT